jgi:hypothetical protein
MKKHEDKHERILGRRLARELPREELERVVGGAYVRPVVGCVGTYTLTYPADGPYNDSGRGPVIA